jgi:hypothetical protein
VDFAQSGARRLEAFGLARERGPTPVEVEQAAAGGEQARLHLLKIGGGAALLRASWYPEVDDRVVVWDTVSRPRARVMRRPALQPFSVHWIHAPKTREGLRSSLLR